MRSRHLPRLRLYLAERIGVQRLRKLGWSEFASFDCPETDDAVEVASEALLALALDDHGNFTWVTDIIAGILAFLMDECKVTPTSTQSAELGRLLKQVPVSQDDVLDWFDSVYPMNPREES